MCGIAGIILKKTGEVDTLRKLIAMSRAISHRGPDGEGFITASLSQVIPSFGDFKTTFEKNDLPYIPSTPLTFGDDSILGFAHRRLSIIDPSDCGHQPMCDQESRYWIVYNGEIYNYLEIKEELVSMGRSFVSKSDTEVILQAYKAWGPDCVKKFNGMWAFCIYDSKEKKCFASRDRLGVKPFYFLNNSSFFAFASEQKAFVKAGLIQAEVSEASLSNYLLNGMMESEPANFFEGLTELFPGHHLFYDVASGECTTKRYYELQESFSDRNESLSEKQLIEKISQVLEESVKLRLRSDVEVGTCLSGGIDSSALAVMMAEQNKQPIFCFTSVFRQKSFNEEHYADLVANQIHAKHFKVEPTLKGFLADADALIYSQDVPIWATSTYAQHKVMGLAKEHGIKVVLDGQGADELFGGYHHHFVAKWKNLISKGRYIAALSDMSASSKTIPHPRSLYLKETIKAKFNPGRLRFSKYLKNDLINSQQVQNPVQYYDDVNQQLKDDIEHSRLKAFLKCEDRCGMWHGVESRTPFSDDIELINLMFSFNGNKKIQHGVSKYLLREAVKTKLPKEIYSRYDKIGFETPMKDWVTELRSGMMDEIAEANFHFLNNGKYKELNPQNNFDLNLLFKLFVLARWKKLFGAKIT